MDFISKSLLSLIAVTAVFLLTLVPLPGVENSHTIQVKNADYPLEMKNTSTLSDGNVWGATDIVSGKMRLATGGHGFLQFVSTCSHEVKHLRFNIEDEKRDDLLSREEEHKRMSGFGDTLLPWNWETACIGLVDERMEFI